MQLGDVRLQVEAAAELAKPLLATPDPNLELYDTELEEPCRLRQLADGSLRCIASQGSSSRSVDEYNDAACTVPLRSCPDTDCVGAILYDQGVEADACSSRYLTPGIWRVTAKATAHYRMSPGASCHADGESTSQLWIVEAVAPSSFAPASLEAAL